MVREEIGGIAICECFTERIRNWCGGVIMECDVDHLICTPLTPNKSRSLVSEIVVSTLTTGYLKVRIDSA